MSAPLCVVHENYLGERRYQPSLGAGERLHRGWGWRPKDDPLYRESFMDGMPVLYRSRWRAERVARREMRRRWCARRNEYKEVSDDE